jgi:hypothetical protein
MVRVGEWVVMFVEQRVYGGRVSEWELEFVLWVMGEKGWMHEL